MGHAVSKGRGADKRRTTQGKRSAFSKDSIDSGNQISGDSPERGASAGGGGGYMLSEEAVNRQPQEVGANPLLPAAPVPAAVTAKEKIRVAIVRPSRVTNSLKLALFS